MTLIIAGILACIFVLGGGFFLTRFIARKYYEEDRPDDTRKKHVLVIGSGATGLIFITIVIVVILIETSLPPCGPISVTSIQSPVCISGTVNIDGSTALQPLVQMIASDYTNKCNGITTFNVQGSTSDEGVRYVEDGTNNVVIGDSDVQAPSQDSDLQDHIVTVAIFCVIINSDVNVTNLNTNTLQDIYSGRVTNWQKIAGQNEAITVYSRPSGSGTRQIFEKYVLNETEGVTSTEPIPTTQDIVGAVANKPGSIGYASLYEIEHYNATHANKVDIITVNGVPADTNTVIDNSYHFWSLEHMYTKSNNAPPLALDLIDYMNSSQGRNIAQSHSYVNIDTLTNFSSSGHCPS